MHSIPEKDKKLFAILKDDSFLSVMLFGNCYECVKDVFSLFSDLSSLVQKSRSKFVNKFQLGSKSNGF